MQVVNFGLGQPRFEWELQMGVMEGMVGLWFSQLVFLQRVLLL